MWIACTGQHIFLQMFDNLVLIYKMNVHLGNLLPTLINNVLPIHNTSLFTLMYKENVLFAIEILHRNYLNLVSRRHFQIRYTVFGMFIDILLETLYKKQKHTIKSITTYLCQNFFVFAELCYCVFSILSSKQNMCLKVSNTNVQQRASFQY